MATTANDYLQSILSAVSQMMAEVDANAALLNNHHSLTLLRELDDVAHETLGDIQDLNTED